MGPTSLAMLIYLQSQKRPFGTEFCSIMYTRKCICGIYRLDLQNLLRGALRLPPTPAPYPCRQMFGCTSPNVRSQMSKSKLVTPNFLQSAGKEACLDDSSSGLFQSFFQGGMNNPLEFLLLCTDYKGTLLILRYFRMLPIYKPGPRHPAEPARFKPGLNLTIAVSFSFSCSIMVCHLVYQCRAARGVRTAPTGRSQRRQLAWNEQRPEYQTFRAGT